MTHRAGRQMARASIRDVARQADVAVSSVSRVLSGHPDVSPGMRERVTAAVQACGYAPDMLAAGLRSGRSMSVGFVVGDISNPLMSSVALAAGVRLAERGYTLLLANSQDTPERDAANVTAFRQRHVDGLLLSLTDEDDAGTAAALTAFGKPAVLLDRDAGAPGASRVLFDHAHGFRLATRHLIGLGHRRIAVIAGSPRVRHTRERAGAVAGELAAAGLPPPAVKLGSLSRAQGQTAARAVLAAAGRPSAIICGGNQLLPGVISAIRASGLRIPGDISLVATDCNDLTEFHHPPIAFVSRDAAALGRAAAESLLRRLDGGGPDTVTLPTAFVATGSCDRAPDMNAAVAARATAQEGPA